MGMSTNWVNLYSMKKAGESRFTGKFPSPVILMGILLFSCHRHERSAIQIIKLDRAEIQNILNASDTLTVDTPRRHDFYVIEHYRNGHDGTLTAILKDSLHNIVGINQTKNGVHIFGAEYFPNGQIKGVLTLNKHGEPDGPAKYYFEDGRIRSFGNWKNGDKVGKWMEYDKDGNLIEH
jgi:hypothetical protein